MKFSSLLGGAVVVVLAAGGAYYFVPNVQTTVDPYLPWVHATAGNIDAVSASAGAPSGGNAGGAARQGGGGGRAGGRNGAAGQAVPVSIAVAQTSSMPIRKTAVGFIVSPATVLVRPQVDALMLEQHVKDGQTVKKGDLLFVLDDSDLRSQLAKDQATLAKDQALKSDAQAEADRQTGLLKTGSATKSAADTAVASATTANETVNADQVLVANDQLHLAYAKITAPIDGRLGAIQVTPGNLVSTTSTTGLVTITQMHPLRASFSLPETDLPFLQSAIASTTPTVVKATITGATTPTASGVLDFVDSTVDSSSGTVKVTASFDNSDLKLWPGQYVSLEVEAGTLNAATVIPTVAIQAGQQGSFVFVVKPDNTTEIRPVTVALADGQSSAISEGLKPGEQVAVEGQSRLATGTHVTVVAQNAKAPAASKKAQL
jgi:multidrug efflux system membrane fusion protein